MDVFSREKRSEVMSRIRSRGNRDTELALIKVFRKLGITGWRRKQEVFGRPDFVFRAQRVAVFVDGCFWHSCPRHSNLPSTNAEFWASKLERNRKRDRLVNRALREKGWSVLRIWEHEIADEKRCASRIARVLRRGGTALECLP